MTKKTVLICGVLSLAALTLGLIESGLEVNISPEPNTYNVPAILKILPSGERMYMAPSGVLDGNRVIMSNPNAGDIMLNINGPSYSKKIKIWDKK